MQRSNAILCLLLILISTVHPTFAAENDAADIGTWMITTALEGFVYRIGDMIYGIGTNGNETLVTNRSATDTLIISLLTWTIDPYEIPEVSQFQDISMVAFVVLGIIALALAYISSNIDIQKIDDYIGEGYTQNRLVDCFIVLLVIPFVFCFGTWVALKLNYVISLMIADYMLLTVPVTSDNFVLYLFMSIAFLFLAAVMLIRAVYIVVFAAISILIGVAYSIVELRQRVTDIIYSFLSILFLQPKILLYATFGMIVIQKFPLILMPLQSFAYFFLACFLAYTGIKTIAGNMVTNVVKVFVFRTVVR
jgi:hypothetical protein